MDAQSTLGKKKKKNDVEKKYRRVTLDNYKKTKHGRINRMEPP